MECHRQRINTSQTPTIEATNIDIEVIVTSAKAFVCLASTLKTRSSGCSGQIRKIILPREKNIRTVLLNIQTVNTAVLTKPVMLKSGAELMYSLVHV